MTTPEHQQAEREALLPCPFCGAGETRIDHQTMWTGMRSQLVCVHVRHWCEKPMRGSIQITGNTEAEAIAAWNRRAGERADVVPLSDEQIEDCIDEASRLFNFRRLGPAGQQLSTYDDWKYWLVRAIERAHGIAASQDSAKGG